MELILQKDLPHQERAIEAVCGVFDGVPIAPPAQFYENPQVDLRDGRIAANIGKIQRGLPPELRRVDPPAECLPLDIKMETGTGKTYVYTKTMFELHKRWGINKFIIVVPSLAIKAGTAQFLRDDYTRRHFSGSCGYGTEIELGVLEAPKSKKKGRSYFPAVVGNFVKGSCRDTGKIYVLLVNMQLLTSNQKRNGRDAGLLWREDYDRGVLGFYRPYDALRATRPFVLIDEPHRFSRDRKAFRTIAEELAPQCMIRFGATFPEIRTGKEGPAEKDYHNLLYDLNACKAFNLGLIKGVAKEHFEPISRREEKVRILSVASRDSVRFRFCRREESAKVYTLRVGDSLAVISDAFEGITLSAIGKSSVEFSNGMTKTAGEELDVDIYMTSYQEQMLRLALRRHFETERENFCNRTFKIKTLALFFIDDITSYRAGSDGKEPYLLTAFERLLREQIGQTLSDLDECDGEYRAYLEASLRDISACHAGYFAQDNDDSDEKIAEEVDDILHGKKKLLSFRNEDGSYNTRRFLFSKWTLKEGWDNPNVFTIAKLRSSGSETGKLQEVGRGLRLPVDENGNRVDGEEFTLNYIVDFTEADFARKLVEQINSESPQTMTIDEEKLEAVAEKLGITPDELFGILLGKHYIDRHSNIIAENRGEFFGEYPDFAARLAADKVRDRNSEKLRRVRIRGAVFAELKELWEIINRRYCLFYDGSLDEHLEEEIGKLLEEGVFTELIATSKREELRSDGTRMSIETASGVQYTVDRPLAYGVFLKRISDATGVPLTVMDAAIRAYAKRHGGIGERFFNESTVAVFCGKFADWKAENLWGKFFYRANGGPIGATALTHADGTPLEELPQGRVGNYVVAGTPCEKYLYDTYAFDSPLERNNLLADIDEVVVYGKIPRRSVAIPTITGGMYSPDFMYVVKRRDGTKEWNVVVETKDVEGKSELRGVEKAKIRCAQAFFAALEEDGYRVTFRTQLKNKPIKQIVTEVLAE